MLLSVMEEKNAVHLQQPEKWKPLLKEKESLPVPPTTATLRIDRGVYDNPLSIENEYESLLELLDVVYPPLTCNDCGAAYSDKSETDQHYHRNHGRRRFKCLHPHCSLAFVSRGALRLHLSQSHLVRSIRPKTPVILHSSSSVYSVYSDLDRRSSSSPSPSPPSPPAPVSVAIPHSHHNNHSYSHSYSHSHNHSHSHSHSHNPHHHPHPHPHPHPNHDPHQDQNQNRYPSARATQQRPHSASLSPTAQSQANPLPRLAPAGTVGVLVSHDTYKRRPSGRAPRGSKKIILSAETDALLNKIYPPLECPACHRLFKRKTNVITHLTDDHYGQEPYHCIFPQCSHPKLYATREGLVYHILRAHDTDPTPPTSTPMASSASSTPSSSLHAISSKKDILTAYSRPRRRPSGQKPLARLSS